MAIEIPFLAQAFRKIKPVPTVYSDLCDWLISYLTPAVLLACVLMVGAKQQFGKPIECWTPAEYPKGWTEFVEDFCFVEKTYFVPFNEPLGLTSHYRENTQGYKQVAYYQWVPFFLLLQAACFHSFYFFWKWFCQLSNVNFEAVMRKAIEIKDADDRTEKVESAARYIEASLKYKPKRAFPFHLLQGSRVSLLYIIMKVAYVTFIVGNFYWVSKFIGTEQLWGASLVRAFINDRIWHSSGYFPRVTYCDLKVRTFGAIQDKTFQCALMLNLVNEKIFILFWYWLVILGIASCISLIYWTVNIFPAYFRKKRIYKYLAYYEKQEGQTGAVKRFTCHALKLDGTLLLQFISSRCGELISAEITAALWRSYTSYLHPLRMAGSQKQAPRSPSVLTRDHDLLENFPLSNGMNRRRKRRNDFEDQSDVELPLAPRKLSIQHQDIPSLDDQFTDSTEDDSMSRPPPVPPKPHHYGTKMENSFV